jgi:rhodanese-related sulfurtransferase
MATGLKEMVAEARGRVQEVSPQDVKGALDGGEELVVLDVREPHEFAQGHLPGALNVPRGMLELTADADSPVADPALAEKRDARVVTYCLRAPGARSLFAADTLAKMGFTNVAAMAAGVSGWTEAGLPVETLAD